MGVGATSAIESAIFGLIGTVLSVQFEILVRQEEHYEFAELLGSDKWLREPVKSIVADGATIATEFPNTTIEDEARRLLQHFCVEFSTLRLDRLRRGQENLQYLIQRTRDAKAEILAVTNVGQGTPHWWREGQGGRYLREIARLDRFSRTTTLTVPLSQREPGWSHLWSHPHAFVYIHWCSDQCGGAGYGRERYPANYCPDFRKSEGQRFKHDRYPSRTGDACPMSIRLTTFRSVGIRPGVVPHACHKTHKTGSVTINRGHP
jgi:hypothetical protein